MVLQFVVGMGMEISDTKDLDISSAVRTSKWTFLIHNVCYIYRWSSGSDSPLSRCWCGFIPFSYMVSRVWTSRFYLLILRYVVVSFWRVLAGSGDTVQRKQLSGVGLCTRHTWGPPSLSLYFLGITQILLGTREFRLSRSFFSCACSDLHGNYLLWNAQTCFTCTCSDMISTNLLRLAQSAWPDLVQP